MALIADLMKADKPTKKKFLDKLAERSGVAIVVLDKDSNEKAAANNNSLCRALYHSEQFAAKCAEYCGMAYDRTAASGGVIEFECHAGLYCKALPVYDRSIQYVAIAGRTFTKADNYRNMTDKVINGEWRSLKPTEVFENILLSSSSDSVDETIDGLRRFSSDTPAEILELPDDIKEAHSAKTAESETPHKMISELVERFQQVDDVRTRPPEPQVILKQEKITDWRPLLSSLIDRTFFEACSIILEDLKNRFRLGSLIWFEKKDGIYEPLTAIGEIAAKALSFKITPDDGLLINAAAKMQSLKMVERGSTTPDNIRTLELFPLIAAGKPESAIGVLGRIDSETVIKEISSLMAIVGPHLEILRLRDEVARRDWLAAAVTKFSDNLKSIDTEDFWMHLTQTSAELLQAERASLLVKNETAQKLYPKASIGILADIASSDDLGKRVSESVIESGRPVLVSNINEIGLTSAPADRRYKTTSFVSYPLVIGDKTLAVLNFADKASGDPFTESDMELLQAIGPQVAVAIDRTKLKEKAGEYKQLSVTDPLTGLLNRRYMDPRLVEEMKRSRRHGFSVALLMLDIDFFKSYNDNFGHPAGDAALKKVSEVLKRSLRGADVAARWGGEEFAVLLPNTSPQEAFLIAERIRTEIKETVLPFREITVSIGIGLNSDDIASATELINAADNALYKAKEAGRNTVRVSGVYNGPASAASPLA